MGRPTKYKPEFCSVARKLCEGGSTDLEIADALEIGISTLKRWKSEHAAFRTALKESKPEADERVERSLYSRATGYEHDEIDIRVVNGEIVQTPIRKFYPPDTTAAIFWLKNRRPDLWRDVNHLDVTKRSVNDLSDDELAAIAAGKAIRKAKNAVDA